ncbi:MAG: DUF6036 family nucleotidyltransferase [Betaproteobacteria bacterium]
MTLDQVERVLSEISRESGVQSFVVIGSLSIFGLADETARIPDAMMISNEVDAYPEMDPGRAPEFTAKWGMDSPFHRQNGYYFDAVSPLLPTLPDGWAGRLFHKKFGSGLTVKFLDPNDAAISKYARGEPKDRMWIKAGIASSLLSIATIEYRVRETRFLNDDERERVKRSIDEDKKWHGLLMNKAARSVARKPVKKRRS